MDSGGEKDASPAKIRKLQGAAMYKCKYMSQWKREFPFIEAVKGDPYRKFF